MGLIMWSLFLIGRLISIVKLMGRLVINSRVDTKNACATMRLNSMQVL